MNRLIELAPPLPLDPGPAPDERALAAWRAALAAAASSPWRASLWMARLEGLRARLDRLRRWLVGLTRTQRRAWARRLAVATPTALLAAALAAGPPAHAANIAVDAGVVVIAADGDCSLREAIVNANDDAATHADCAAGSGADVIILPAASTFTVPDVDNTTYGENGLPSVTSEITIDGNGAIVERAPADPDTFRLFHVAATGDLTLDATTVRYGVADDTGEENGGGILSTRGELAITNGSVITGNTANDVGGGVYQEYGSLTIADSTISDNRALAAGGGVAAVYADSVTITGSTITGNSASLVFFVGGGGVLVAFGPADISSSTISGNSAFIGGGMQNFAANIDIDHSTISDNSAYYGGGLANLGFYAPGYGTTTLTNSTISGNSALAVGGGILNGGAMAVRNSTITGNSAAFAGGIAAGFFSGYATTDLTNSIVADQVNGADCYATAGSSFTSGDFNLDSDNSCVLTGPNDIPAGNANLGPLALNAPGTTETHALLPGSDALNAGDCSGGTVTDDQRTVLRPQGLACDIGAFELEQVAPTAVPPTAATVLDFAASQDPTGRVTLTWATAAEADVAGFDVYRATGVVGGAGGGAEGWVKANAALIPAQGAAAGGARYRYVDEGAPGIAEPLRYRLDVVNSGGPPQSFGPIDVLRRFFRAVLPWVGRGG